jgi:hypothetical protein
LACSKAAFRHNRGTETGVACSLSLLRSVFADAVDAKVFSSRK